jgi:hypothetical protein
MEQSRPRKKLGLVAGALALIMAASLALMVNSSVRESATMDELAHIPAGYSYVKLGDFRLNPEHPPLLKALAAFPLLFANLNFPTDAKAWTSDVNGQWEMGTLFIYQSGNNADLIIQLSRIAPMVLTLALIFFTWVFAKKIMGKKWALIPAAFTAFSPTFLAHGHYVTTDVAAAFGIMSATYFFVKAIEKDTWKNLGIAGIFFGIAQLLKFSMFLLVPYFMLLAAVWGTAKALRSNKGERLKKWLMQIPLQLKNLAVVFVIGYALIYPVYALFTINYPVEKQVSDTEYIMDSSIKEGGAVGFLAETTVKMAGNKITRPYAEYALGFLMVSQRASGGNTGYFLGEISGSGWKHYFPVVYALKEPLPFLLLAIAALGSGIYAFAKKPKKTVKNLPETTATRFPEMAIGIFILVYAIVSIRSPLNIGIRHLMPILPFIYVLSVEAIRLKAGRAAKPIMAACFAWLAVGTAFSTPYYISYFNEIGGGVWGGYKYVTDSNYDWGQDLKRLAEFTEENGIDKIAVDYFGGGNPKYYIGEDKADYWWSSKGNPADSGMKWFALSVNTLQQAKARPAEGFDRKDEDTYPWLQNPYEPYARIGTSIFVYKLAE